MNAIELVNQPKDTINVRRVYGEPYQEDGLTIIPAANVMGGGGAGGDTEGNGGGGFGVRARPAGAWVIKAGGGPCRRPLARTGRPGMVRLAAPVGPLALRSTVRPIAR